MQAGKVPGGYLKREGRPSEVETLTSRQIDRPIRPLFPEVFRNETQVVCTVMSYDPDCDPTVAAMVAASAALTISGIPFLGPIGAANVGYIDGKYVLNPTPDQNENSQLKLSVAGTSQGVLMVESEAKELSEDVMLGAVNFGHTEMQPVIEMIIELARECAKDPWELPEEHPQKKSLVSALQSKFEDKFRKAYDITDKQKRATLLSEIRSEASEALVDEENNVSGTFVGGLTKKLEAEVVRGDLLKTGKRIDGRDTKTVRPIETEINFLPRAHGSALFTRGETQAIVTTTLGSGRDEQMYDTLDPEVKKERFMLHYNFPSYSVGEARRMAPPGRREIGHGKLAWRAINPLLPTNDEFPYSLRVVSEITESNGSSSMATVCGTSMSLMAAGVPLPRPVAGIAMGLIKEDDDFTVISDILGDEDHLGDMDFKVAGTQDGITALQMDIKITSITPEIMETALSQAKDGRLHILGEMAKTLSKAATDVAEHAPKVVKVQIPTDKIGEVIGPGGSNIKKIIELTGATVDIDDNGVAVIGAKGSENLEKAKHMVESVFVEPEIGAVYEGTVVGITDFGAFVNFFGSKDGLVHISELADKRVEKVSDIVQMGQEVKVKCIGIDQRGKIKLSMKALLEKDEQVAEV